MNSNNPSSCSPDAGVSVVPSENYRALPWNERVRRGDFIATDRNGFELWDGPIGFRADAYVKTIYRKLTGGPVMARKSR